MLKLSETVQMSFIVPQHEKADARECSKQFLAAVNSLSNARDHLEIIENAFKKSENISPELLHEKRGLLNRYKQQVVKNFEEVQVYSIHALNSLELFSSDIHVEELFNSYKDSQKDIQKAVNIILDVLDNYKDEDFKSKLITSIDNVKEEIIQLEQLVRDRIIEFIDDNILSKNWMTDITDKFNLDLKKNKPYLLQVFEEQNQTINGENGSTPQIAKRPQSLTPADNQRAWTPTDLRDVSERGEGD